MHKLQYRSLPYVFLGYCQNQKGYKCLHISTNKIYVSRNVHFDETIFPFSKHFSSAQINSSLDGFSSLPITQASQHCSASFPIATATVPLALLPSQPSQMQPRPGSASSQQAVGSSHQAATTVSQPATISSQPANVPSQSLISHQAVPSPSIWPSSNSSLFRPSSSPSTTVPCSTLHPTAPVSSVNNSASTPLTTLPTTVPCTPPVPSVGNTLVPTTVSTHHMVTRQKDHTSQPKHFLDHVTFLITNHPLPISNCDKPTLFTIANKSPEWREAMAKELNVLAHNNTWILVPPPPNQRVIGCKWIYKIKCKADGSI